MTEKRKSFLFLIIFLLVNSFGISESLKDENYFALKKDEQNLMESKKDSEKEVLENEVKITKANKKEKTKNVKLSYEEVDFFKLQLKETLKGIDAQRAALKWYNLIKKALFKTLTKQTEAVLEEFNSGSVKKK